MRPRDKVLATIRKHSMLKKGDRALVALSGGPDSVCLLHMLNSIKNILGISVSAMYIDHGLRPKQTPGEIKFCGHLCSALGIEFAHKKIDAKGFAKERGLSLQEAGRELRLYELDLRAYELKADAIAFGHNMDDQAETFLMRAVRGSGMKGLSAIPPVRGKIIRPLIWITRDEIESYLAENGLEFVTDPSNLKDEYLRNALRLNVMPLLKEINPSVSEALSRTAALCSEENDFLEYETTKTMMRLVTRKSAKHIELFSIPMEGINKVILRRILRRAIEAVEGLRGISLKHVEDIIGLIKEGKPGDMAIIPKGLRAVKKYSTILITSEPALKISPQILESGGTALIQETGFQISVSAISVEKAGDIKADGKTSFLADADKLSFPLSVRRRKTGDFFHPAGFGKRRKLQDFFVDVKIPRDERDAAPLVISGDDIVWIAGFRGDERFLPTEKTKRFALLKTGKINE